MHKIQIKHFMNLLFFLKKRIVIKHSNIIFYRIDIILRNLTINGKINNINLHIYTIFYTLIKTK